MKYSFEFEQPTMLKEGDIVWVRWMHTIIGDIPDAAIPTKIIRVYDDGNILHQKSGYDNVEFAWARDIFAKTPSLPIDSMPYRRVPVADIRRAIYQITKEGSNA